MNNQATRRWPLWLPLIISIMVFCVLSLLFAPEKPKDYPPYLTASPSPTGVKAFYTYVKNESEQHVHIWHGSESALNGTGNNALMLMIEPDQPFTKNERLKWERWMKKGNTILLMVNDPKDYFSLRATRNHKVSDHDTYITGESELGGHYLGKISTAARLIDQKGDDILLKDGQGTLALSRPYGKGKLVVLLAPDWLTNDHILRGDQLKAVMNLLNALHPDDIWFNEAIHGSNDHPGLLDVYPSWLIVLFAQLFFVLLLFLWYKGKRFGPVDLPREAAIRVSDERLQAIAKWYMRGRLYKDSLAGQEAYLRQRLEDNWHISARLDARQMLDELRKRLPNDAFLQWQSTYSEWEKLRNKSQISKKEYLSWADILYSLLKEVEKQ